MVEQTSQGKDRSTLLLGSVLLVGSATVFAVSADAPHILILTIVALGISASVTKPLPRTTRTYVYAMTIVGVVTVLSDQVFPVDSNRFFLLPAKVYCPVLLGIGVASTFLEYRDITLTTIISCSLLATMLGGNAVSGFPTNPRFPFSDWALVHFHVFFGLVVAVQMVGMILLLGRVEMRRSVRPGSGRYVRSRWSLVAVSLVVCAAGVLVEDGDRLVAIYPYRDADHSKVTLKTVNVLMLMCGSPGITLHTLSQASSVARDILPRFCGGRAE